MTGTPVLACDALTRRYGDRTVVDGVSFTIAAGETYGLLGPNGAGKTTTINMVCGLVTPDSGTVHILGEDTARAGVAIRGHLGLVPQDIALYPDLSARENLEFFGRLQGLAGAGLRRAVDNVLEVVGLGDRAGDRIEHYSGGMKRRANIAVGLLHEPELLILDEPTVGVDPQSRNAILEAIETLGGAGLSVLYTTHYMEEAERLCDRVGIIDEGVLVAEGTRAELIERVGVHTHVRVQSPGNLATLAEACRRLPDVLEVSSAPGAVDLLVSDGHRVLAPVVEAAEAAGVAVGGIDLVEPTLETVFLQLTGKALRD